jgi:hypothetical protein
MAITMWAFTATGPNNGLKKAPACIFIWKPFLKLVDVHGICSFFEKILHHDFDRYGQNTLNLLIGPLNYKFIFGLEKFKIGYSRIKSHMTHTTDEVIIK